MTQYQIIARKYRPQTFKEVWGQEAIVITLQNAIRLGKAAQAYLFCGLRGTGKTTLARLFAKTLNCANLTEDLQPCNQCPSCKEITSGRSLDVIEIDGASNRGIDDIRQLNETVGFAPSSGEYKIYIIDEVHMLTKEAFNALLKTLEEPPPHVKFFFATTEPHKVLPTIISRCQRFDLKRISEKQIAEKLKMIAKDHQLTIEDEALFLIAQFAEGSLRDAESLFDQILCYHESPITAQAVISTLGLFEKDLFFSIDKAAKDANALQAFILGEKIFSSGKDLTHFLDDLAEHVRTHLLLKLNGENFLHSLSSSLKKKYLETNATYSKAQCLYLLDYLSRCLEDGGKTLLKRIHLEKILLHIIESSKRIPIEEIAKRLIDLEKNIPKENSIPPPPPQKIIIDSPPPQKIVEKIEQKEKPLPPQLDENEKIRQENLMRFASVELNGTLKK